MTLIITTLRPQEMLITADGRSVTTTVTGERVVRTNNDHFQKIFPVPDHPVVIFNHGENHFDGQAIGTFLAEFMKGLNTGNHTIEEISDELRYYAHARVRRRLKGENAKATRTCGLCVGGFGTGAKESRLVEVFWKLTGATLLTEENQWGPTTIVTSGSGSKQIEKTLIKEVDNTPLEQVQRYHQKLMDEALNAKVDNNTVGGQVHELLITRNEWKWLRKPTPASG